ncbi:hypothetical protein Tco_0886545 [Tanacetum coccineum]
MRAENPTHFRQRGNDDGYLNRKAKNSTAIHEGASGKSKAAPCLREGPRKSEELRTAVAVRKARSHPAVIACLPLLPSPGSPTLKCPQKAIPHQAVSIAKCSATKQALPNMIDAEVGKSEVAKEVGGRK